VPKTPDPKDRFDDLPVDRGRVGAHRAENPRLRGGLVLLWSAVATVALIAIGIFGTLVATGRVVPFPAPSGSPAPVATAEPTIDTGYTVLVLNATGERGLANLVRDEILDAGWAGDAVLASEAGADDFELTTVYYPTAEDEGAARGVAQLVGATRLVLDDAYQPADDPDARQLAVVIGLDRAGAAGDSTPTP